MQDWQSLDEAIQLGLIRSRLRAEGKVTLNVREGMPASDMLRRAFLRAYAHEELGLTKTYSYPALARWLTDLGYPTKVSEPRGARSQKVVLGCVPRTEDVLALFERLQAEFSGGGVGEVAGGGGRVGLLPYGCSLTGVMVRPHSANDRHVACAVAARRRHGPPLCKPHQQHSSTPAQ